MKLQDFFHGAYQAIYVNIVVSIMAGARSIASIDRLVVIEEENAKRQIKVELKQPEIETVALNQTNGYELVGQISKLVFATNNLLVKCSTSRSGNTTKHDHQWFVRSFGFLDSTFEVIVKPAFIILEVVPIVANFFIAGLRQRQAVHQEPEGEQPKYYLILTSHVFDPVQLTFLKFYDELSSESKKKTPLPETGQDWKWNESWRMIQRKPSEYRSHARDDSRRTSQRAGYQAVACSQIATNPTGP